MSVRESNLHKGPAALVAACGWRVKSWKDKSPIWHGVRACRDNASRALYVLKQTVKTTPSTVAGHTQGLASDVMRHASQAIGGSKAKLEYASRTISQSLAHGADRVVSRANFALTAGANMIARQATARELNSRNQNPKMLEMSKMERGQSALGHEALELQYRRVYRFEEVRIDGEPPMRSPLALSSEDANLLLAIQQANLGFRLPDSVLVELQKKANQLTGTGG